MTLPSQQASIAWTFHPHNAKLDIVFFGTFISPSGWVGWGINPTSAQMTGTRALITFPDPNSGQLVLLPYILDPTVKLQRTELSSRPLDIHLLSSSATLYGGRMAMVHNGATIEIYATLKLIPNKTKIHLVWNRGLYVQGYSPTIHPTTTSDLSSISTIDVMSGTAAAGHSNIRTLKVVHGVINALSWGILLPIGAATARYLRHIQALGPAWFYAHAGTQIFSFFLGTVGFAIGILLGELSPGRVYGLHRKLGFAAFCLGGLQTLALLFRPKTTNKFRKYWKSYHHFVGYACVVLGVVNVFQGFEVMGENSGLSREKGVHRKETTVENSEGFIGFLEVYIYQARDIHNICIYHKQDVYAKLCLTSDPDTTVSTQIINGGGKNPVFNENLRLNVRTVDSSLKSGFVQLSLTYSGALPEVLEIPRPVSSLTATAAPLDSEIPTSIPNEFDKIEFPDPKIVNENEMMVSEYFGIPCANDSESAENLGTTENANHLSSEEIGVRIVESFSRASLDGVEVSNFQNQDAGSPTKEIVEDCQGCCNPRVVSLFWINMNIEAEQKVMQEEIVEMYMKSMQQFTESLAKMKLPYEH
ncbi:hypothetical protein F0562_008218 [Nyssa sinensis]|uniref:C2 domain-containing protein n=1 Tax=Nyssa sinensis TaxID=561372 RepID=A0A5J5A8F4_9ASTE|nr:hypothetical protein F0562_008218 [Nyssa sinensis]